jgi:Bacteriophage Sf6, terminase small subunit-like
MPGVQTVLDLARRDSEFAGHYARARELGYMVMADEILDIADESTKDGHHQRLRVDTRKWMLSKVLPKIYGDRLHVAGDPNAPLMLKTDVELAHEIRALMVVARKRLEADKAADPQRLRGGNGRGNAR